MKGHIKMEQKENQKENQKEKSRRSVNRSSSIAWELNLANQWKRLGSLLFSTVLILAVILLVWILAAEQMLLPEGAEVVKRYFEGSIKSWKTFHYVLADGEGTLYIAAFGQFLQLIRIPFLAGVGISIFGWAVGFINGAESYRKYLKPIDEIALAAEEISSRSITPERFSNLEEAIEHIDGSSPELTLNTGDSDLQGLEAAINNMLKRLHNSYRQQIRFVDDASHELRTPIAVIQGYINLLDRWGKSDENVLEEAISAIKSEADHMNTLVEQLLFLARGDAGRQKFEPEPVDLLVMMEEIVEESQMIDPDHRYELQISENIQIQADYAMLKQSVRILIDNAAKYSEQGSRIRIRLYTREAHSAREACSAREVHSAKEAYSGKETGFAKEIYPTERKKQVCIEVQDHGMGIGKQDMVHMFERLYRGDPARNSKTGGSGLGLSIARWIVEKHGGFFEVLSYEEIGTRITIVLP